MRLVGRIACPAIERVIDQHPGLKLVQIVGMDARQAKRHGQQARRPEHLYTGLRIKEQL